MRLGCPTWMLKIPSPTTSNRVETPASCTTASNTEVMCNQNSLQKQTSQHAQVKRKHYTLQIIPDTWSEDASGRVWRRRRLYPRSTIFAPLHLTSHPYCLTRTAARRSTLGKLACTAAWRRRPDPAEGTRTMLTATCGLQCSPTLGMPWKESHISPSRLTSPMQPLFPPSCHIQHHP